MHFSLSVALLFGKEIFAGDHVALSVIEAVQNVLGVQALCSFAAKNTSYHSGLVSSPSQKFQRRASTFTPSTRSARWRGN